MTSSRRTSRSKFWRVALVLLSLSLVSDFMKLSWIGNPAPQGSPLDTPRPMPTLYVASIFWNSAAILHSNWNNAIVELAEKLGPDRIFISIYESGSWDETKHVLRQLERVLQTRGIRHRIILDETTHEDDLARPPTSEGWVRTPRGRTELRRIPYLSKLRNKTLDPLAELAANGTTFKNVLFLNDVAFTIEDIWTLLATNAGNYAAACSLDFSKPPNFYDTFALRDSEGHERLMMTYPYFRSRKSRQAMVSNRPVPVQSCWNGMVAFDSSPFYSAKPLQFRGISDSLATHHLEGSECCLIHADNPQSALSGVWLNPQVRVGYDPYSYAVVHSMEPWPSFYDRFIGLWQNRIRRWVTTVWFKEWLVRKRIEKWAKEDRNRYEPGTQCLINEMQVLVHNGWAHV